MGNLRPVLIVGLVFLGYMMWVEWQKDYGMAPAARPEAVSDEARYASDTPDVPSMTSAPAQSEGDLPAPVEQGPAPSIEGSTETPEATIL